MLRAQSLSYALPDRPLLDDVSFEIHPGEHVGLIGRNGSGKTTLLRLLTGQLPPRAGSVQLTPPGARIGYLRQGFVDEDRQTIGEALGPAGVAWAAQHALDALGTAMAAPDADLPALLDRYGAAQEQLAEGGGEEQAQATQAVIAGLGLAAAPPDAALARLSGGQRTRLGLARLLLERPDLLILDEPTNHLDLGGILWLEDFLRRYRGAVLLVSHDRVFLDRAVTRILALADGTLRSYPGGYSAYRAAAEAEEAEQWQTYRRQERVREHIEEEIRREQDRAQRTELTTIDFALRAKAKKGARQAKVKERRLERMLHAADRVEKPRPEWEVKLDFGHVPPGSRQALVAEGLSQRYGALQVLRGVSLQVRAGERVVLTGPNGGGKSTLVKALAGALQTDAGSVRLGESTRLGYLSQDQADLPPDETPLALVRRAAPLDETAARGYLHFFLFAGDQVFTPVNRLSYGERSRLSLALILLGGANLLLLDEPLNHLDIPARERLEGALLEYPGASLIVAHDRAFIARVATRILVLDDGRLREYPDAERFEAALTRGEFAGAAAPLAPAGATTR